MCVIITVNLTNLIWYVVYLKAQYEVHFYLYCTSKDNVNTEMLQFILFAHDTIISFFENLTWKDHIDAISKTMSRNVGMINKLKYFVPNRMLLSLY